MTATNSGWILFVAALGMMASLMGNELVSLKTWSEATTIAFVGKTMIHFGVVVAAFVGGRLIPTERDSTQQRKDDK